MRCGLDCVAMAPGDAGRPAQEAGTQGAQRTQKVPRPLRPPRAAVTPAKPAAKAGSRSGGASAWAHRFGDAEGSGDEAPSGEEEGGSSESESEGLVEESANECEWDEMCATHP